MCLIVIGNALIVSARNFTVENVYVSKVEFDGKILDIKNLFLQHSGTTNSYFVDGCYFYLTLCRFI